MKSSRVFASMHLTVSIVLHCMYYLPTDSQCPAHIDSMSTALRVLSLGGVDVTSDVLKIALDTFFKTGSFPDERQKLRM